MSRLTTPALLLAFAWSTPAVHAASKIDLERVTPVPADQPIPIQDFFRPRALSQPVINRAGTHIAAVVAADQDKHLAMVYDIATSQVDSHGSTGEKDIYNVHWLGNSRILFQMSTRKYWGIGIMAADIRNLRGAYPIQQYNGSSVVSIPLKDPLHPLVWNRHEFESRRDNGVSLLDSSVQSGMIVDLTMALSDTQYVHGYTKVREQNQRTTLDSYPMPPAGEMAYGYLGDKAGELAYAFTSNRGSLSLFRLENRKWIRCNLDLEEVSVIGAANQPNQLLVIGPSRDGKPGPLQIFDAATGQLGDVVLQDPLYDFNGWLYRNPSTGDVLGAIFDKAGPRVYWFNEEYKALQKILDGMFPGQVVRILGSDDQQKIFLVATASDRNPVAYHWVNLERRTAGLFKNSAPWIDPARMRPMQILQFKTRDGQKLDGYLTLPDGASKEKPAPLVVLCHGGPWARDYWGFDGEAQFLASRGYAVFQPNYRGSTGSTGRFPDADEYDYVKMHQDVTDGVKAVLSSGLIDRNRVGIMGASFGGYLAVSGVAHEPDLYRCAVTNAGVFDWALQVQSEKYDQYDLPYYARLLKKLGNPSTDAEKYAAMSPINFVQNIRVPVFVAGGKDDQTVELQQSRKLINAFERHNVVHEKLFIGGEGHGMAHLENQVELYGRIETFLDKYLMAGK